MKGGFTLVEVLVALVLAGLGVSIAGGVFGASSDAIERLNRASEAWTHTANATTWLTEALMSAEVDPGAGVSFNGSLREMHFSGWQWTSGGWVEPAWADVFFDAEGLEASTSRGLDLSLLRGDGGFIQYLPQLGAETAWKSDWNSDTSLPAAVRIIIRSSTAAPLRRADTLVVLVGAGG